MQSLARELRIVLDERRPEVGFDIIGNKSETPSPFRIMNMSRTGMFVASEKMVDEGTPVRFSLSLKDQDRNVSGLSTVQWVRSKSLSSNLPKGFGLSVSKFFQDSDKFYTQYLESCLDQLRVEELMREDFPFVKADTTVSEAVNKMHDLRVGGVCVVDQDNTPLGFFTEKEVSRFYSHANFGDSPVDQFIKKHLQVLRPEQEAEFAYEALRFSDEAFVPVIKGNQAVGVVVTADMLPFWGELMELKMKRLKMSYEKATSVIVHDLRSPIAAIKTTNALLTGGQLKPEEYVESECHEMVEHSCDVMLMLIDDLLDITAVKQGKIRLKREPIDFKALADRVTKSFRAAATAKGIDFEVYGERDLPLISADSVRLEQILHNLISNAFKFSPPGASVDLTIEKHDLRGIKFRIKDTGQGIPEDELPKLFREFSRLSVRPTAGEKSTGLGLAITQKLVEAHGGWIEVQSKVGEGTTFVIFLPSNSGVASD